jgi:hypothetical protein
VRVFKIPPRISEVQLLRAEVAALRREYAALASAVAAMPRPARERWERHSAPEMDTLEEAPSLLQLLTSSQQA